MRFPGYSQDPRIHNVGNVGWGGRVHAVLAPWVTALITASAYGGVEPRAWLHQTACVGNVSVVDLACGVGLSTPRGGLGVDSSREMLDVARVLDDADEAGATKRFVLGNAETWGEDACCDVATIAFAFHEMPRRARLRTLRNALRIARRRVIVVDICPTYVPSRAMLTGEPYMLDYLRHVDRDLLWPLKKQTLLDELAEAADDVVVWPRASTLAYQREVVLPGHVVAWTLWKA